MKAPPVFELLVGGGKGLFEGSGCSLGIFLTTKEWAVWTFSFHKGIQKFKSVDWSNFLMGECLTRFKLGAAMGASVGASIGLLLGGFSILR